jgi:LPXTG-motif cell wall-anchored protein
MTLIIVAASGVVTLLTIAGIYLYSKKKKNRRE